MGFLIGGIVCVLYAAATYFIAYKRPARIMGIIKKKLGGRVSDKGAAIVAYVFASVVLAGGIVLFVFAGLRL